jgi:SAM-dependent methyltransferase
MKLAKTLNFGRAADLRVWERAEIVRSASEAGRRTESLRTSQNNVRRYAAPSEFTPYPLEYVFAILGNARDLRVLDLGCGSGLNSLLLAFRGAHVVGVDISADLLTQALTRFEVNAAPQEPRFVASSAHALPFADGSFDLVVGIAILHHLDLALVRNEVHRVLRTGGRAIFQEPVRSSRLARWLRRLIPYHPPDISPFERPLLDSELTEFARPFSACRTRAFGLPHVKICQLVTALRGYLRRAYEWDRAIIDRWPRAGRYASIRVVHLVK